MHQHYVHFFSPGTLFSEETKLPVASWDVDEAQEIAHTIKERHGATPYGFCFSTRSRGEKDLDSKESARSCIYYLGGKVETREEIEARNDPKEQVLRSNMEINGYDRVIVNTNSWRFTGAMKASDVVLDWKPRTA